MASTQAGAEYGGTSPVSPVDAGRGAATNPKMRKRTKTGCLTCRKRRIKCGEERPTCANCIKSKRQCEGYNQRVVFKPPIGDWPNHPGVMSTMQFHNSLLPGARPAYRNSLSNPPSPQERRPSIQAAQPRPATQFDFSNVEVGPSRALESLSTHKGSVGGPSAYHHQPPHSPHSQLPTPTSAASYFPSQPSPAHASFPMPYPHSGPAGYEAQQIYPQASQYQQAPAPYDHQTEQNPIASQAPLEQAMYQHPRHPTGTSGEQNPYMVASHGLPRGDGYPQYSQQRSSLNRYGSNQSQHPPLTSVDYSQQGLYAPSPATSYAHPTHSNFQAVQIPQHDVDSDVKFLSQHARALGQPQAVAAPSTPAHSQPQLHLGGFGGVDHVSPTQVLDEAAIECEDDDYYDVQSDEEMPDEPEQKDDDDAVIRSRDFSLIQRMHRENTGDLDVRRFDSFIYEGILTHYQPEQVANPLKNPKTARVFVHFIHVTGPTLSIYERNPRNPSSLYEGPIPPSHQSLWTYILPLKALNHQGLLHAMLALASLHIARLQKASITPSLKHYAYALKRLGRSLGDPKKRLQISTLATSLLLAYYEVMTAEHMKWSTHLVGAAQLLSELDFRTLTREARRLKAAQVAQEQQFQHQTPHMLMDQKQLEKILKESSMMPDEDLVSTIVGKRVNYDDFGRVFEESSKPQERRRSRPEKLDLRGYETLQDLYWWYARQDLYQSIVSGNPLIMDYRKWSDCPPRSALGRSDVLFGSQDHIILLVGRIADFIYRDRERKIRQVEANGGHWRPTPGMPGMGPPSQSQGQHGQPPTATTPMGPPPHMQGMGPPPGWSGPPHPGWKGPHPSPTGPPSSASMGTGPSGPPGFMPPPSPGQGGMPPPPPRGPRPAAGPGFYGMAPSRPPIPLPASYVNPTQAAHGSPKAANTSHAKFSDLPLAYEAALSEWNSISHAHATIAQILSNTPSFAPLTPDLYPTGPNGNMTPFGPALLHRSYDISILWALLHLSRILLLRSHPAMPPASMVAAAVCAPATQPYAILIGRIAAGLQIPASKDTPLTPALGAALIESTIPLFFAGVQYQEPAQREWLVERLLEVNGRTGWASAGVIARSCETSWEKAAELGRGPPYKRRTRRIGETDADGGVDVGRRGSTADGGVKMRSMSTASNSDVRTERPRAEWDEGDKRFIVRRPTGQLPWAMNILATDEDLRVGMERVVLEGKGRGGSLGGGGTQSGDVGDDGGDEGRWIGG